MMTKKYLKELKFATLIDKHVLGRATLYWVTSYEFF